MRRFDGKLVVITGAAGGIGSALARAFAARGADLALIDLHADRLAELADTLAGPPGASPLAISTHSASVGDPEALARARTEILDRHGRVDLLINNAGITVFAEFEATEPDEIERILDVNLRGVVYGCKIFLPDLRAQPGAHIVNVSSMSSLAGMPWQTLYCATKFAVRGFTASLRCELARHGIGVTCVMPGTTRTGIVGAAAARNPALRDQLSGLLLAYGYPPRWVANQVVRAVRWNRAELRVGPDARALALAVRVSPWLVRASMRALVWLAGRRGLTS
jgi:NAD(P)-dependent dehydrogenase (short-subunit alcohol dehydrogenase family)